jgi:hypothetical protein
MDNSSVIEVVDRDGWRKEFPLQKRIVYIGSDAHNDIVLEASRGSGVIARHLQLIGMSSGGYRLVNLGSDKIEIDEGNPLPPHATTEVLDGLRLQVGQFRLVFQLSGVAPQASHSTSQAIGLSLSLPHRQLTPDAPLEGAIIVKNRGNQAGVQFRLSLEGLSTGSYEMGPAPLLFPNAEKAVSLKIYHPNGPSLPAGKHPITVRASAPEAYPNESAEARETIEVLPLYEHSLRLVPYG